jgi:nucleoside-diphosphate-sugar epimerase
MQKESLLITGANGQIGTVLSQKLIEIYGYDNVLTTDIGHIDNIHGRFEKLDIMDVKHFQELIDKYKITQIYHLASLLSAKGEKDPMYTWNINLNGLLNVLNLAKDNKINKLFFPSSIAVFGDTTPKMNTAQDVPLVPDTVYGIGKVTGELWCNYYSQRYGMDIRSIRYPGIIGYQSLPGGGTTDYAVDIFHKAVNHEKYNCFLKEDTMMPMMYMDDAIHATIMLMEAPEDKIKLRYGYNLAAFSFTPEEIYLEIKKYYPDFEIEYNPDFRQHIADSWVKSINDSKAREDWGWKPAYTFEQMVKSMISHLRIIYKKEEPSLS